MKTLLSSSILLIVMSSTVFADRLTILENGSHTSFLGNEAIDTNLYESYEGSGASYEYNEIKNIFIDAISVLRRDYPNKQDEVKRDAHAKSHGCVKAKFQVNNKSLPTHLRTGIFKENKTFDTWIRFSNNHSDATRHDNIKDVRGMSLKLLNVEGDKILPDEKYAKTQDLLMFGSPVFFIKNNRHYKAVLDFVNHGAWAALKTAMSDPSSLAPLVKGFRRLSKEQKRILNYTNPANMPYFSATPYRLGLKDDPKSTAIKFGAHRVKCADESFVRLNVNKDDESTPNYLKDSLAHTLKQQPVCFQYWVQPIDKSNSKISELVEDPSIEWKSPKINVAILKVRKQTFDTPEQNNFCENLSFTPWHSLNEHRPLGRTNRARGILYNVISKHRHSENNVQRKEPLSLNIEEAN